MGEVVEFPICEVTVADAVGAFEGDKDLSVNARRSYRVALNAIIEDLGADHPVADLDAAALRRVVASRWGTSAPATWNARVTALQPFSRYCAANGWMPSEVSSGLERRRVPRDDTRAIPYEDLEGLWGRRDVALREKTLWRMLYETAARANEVLALDIADVDLARKRATVTGKGGHREVIVWASGTARLLPRYLGGRRRGPVFVTSRRPNVVPADVDRCPDTGLGRLSYQRAWKVFHDASAGSTLHQLRHSALTHLGEAGVSAPLLQAKSRHHDPRTLARYVKPGIEAVAALTAEHDPGRRHRS